MDPCLVGPWLFAALVAAGACCGQHPLEEWGPVWQPRLPAQERHPYLFYDEADRARMIARLDVEPWQSWWASIQRQGLRSTPAVRWWLQGGEADARLARDDLVERPIWREPDHGYLEPSSHRFADYVIAYDVLAAWDGLSPEDHAVVRDRIAAEADHYYAVFDGVPGGANYGNQRTLAASALGMAALTLCEYTNSPIGPAKWLERALHEIRRDENFWFFRPGGLFVEGLGYTNYMNVQFVPFAIAYERATGQYIFTEPRLREWLVFAAHQLMNNGEAVMWGTCESARGLGFLGLLTSERYGRDLAFRFHHTFHLREDPVPHPYHVHIALAHYEPEVAGETPSASHYFPESQTVVLREDWGHETTAVWFAGKDETWPLAYRYQTYSHADVGHFVLAAWDEVLAADSGYDHWKSREHFAAEFHNVVLIDGTGPAQDTPGELSNADIDGPVRHGTVTTAYQGCTVRRTLALVRGRYVLVADHIAADAEHEYVWQVRSMCPPESPGTHLSERAVTWPGLSAAEWRELKPGCSQLTTVVPSFCELTLEEGRWRPMSGKPDFTDQVALARWRAAESTALFALIPNLREAPDLTWEAGQGQDLVIRGRGWADGISIGDGSLLIDEIGGGLHHRIELEP